MPLQPLNMFNVARNETFWREHRLAFEQGQMSFEPRPQRNAAAAGSRPLTPAAQRNMYKAVRALLENSRSTAATDALLVASNNVKTFNAAFPDLPKLPHPAVLTRSPAVLSIRQVAFEMTQIERVDHVHAAKLHSLLGPLSGFAPASGADLILYERAVLGRLQCDFGRLKDKYGAVAHVTRAAFDHAESAREVAARYGMQVLKPANRHALRDLQTAVKRSLSAAKQDLARIEGLYNRAASAAMQLRALPKVAPRQDVTNLMAGLDVTDSAPASPTGVKPGDSSIPTMRLTNLFGPGEMVVDTHSAGVKMRAIVQETLGYAEDLRIQILRPRTSELTAVDGAIRQLLASKVTLSDTGMKQAPAAGSTKRLDLGPLGGGRLFQRA